MGMKSGNMLKEFKTDQGIINDMTYYINQN